MSSLLMCAIAAVVVFVWSHAFDYPPGARVHLCFGLLKPTAEMVTWAASALFGTIGLTSLVSFNTLQDFLRNILSPMKLINDDLKRFWSLHGVLIAASVLLLLSLNLLLANWTLVLSTDYEILVTTHDLSSVEVVDPQGEVDKRLIRMFKDDELRLLIHGLRASAVLLIRDELSLVPLDALCIKRRVWLSARPCQLGAGFEGYSSSTRGLVATGPLTRRVASALRGAEVRVANPITLPARAAPMSGGYIAPGEPIDGPEVTNQPYGGRFARIAFWQRDSLSQWLRLTGASDSSGKLFVQPDIWGYKLRIDFETGEIESPDGSSIHVRIARTIHATETEISVD